MESNGELDRTLDSALAGYSDVEPLAGLEERVLYRVQAAEARRRSVLVWAFAFVAAAALVVPVIVMRAPRHSEPKNHIVGQLAVKRPAPAVEKPRLAPKRLAKSRPSRQRLLPKQEQFPAPRPISAEERALLALVREHPAKAQEVFVALQKSGEPIEIPAIQIPPLQSDGAR
jgi:hypothetical protein